MGNSVLQVATSLAGLVDYQSGSVVSRTLVNKPAGTITLFAFDEDQSLSEHTTPYDALVLGLDGELGIRIGEEGHRLRSGDALRLPANRPHAVHARQRSKMLLVMIRE